MKISTVLDHIDSGHMALPRFQRGYVWNREQVRRLFHSLYRRYPVGGLLVWVTDSQDAERRGEGAVAPGQVKLLMDGQQRMTSLYGVMRGRAPDFFDGDEWSFTGLWFHLEEEVFEFYQKMKMQDDPLWVDVTALMRAGHAGLHPIYSRVMASPDHAQRVGELVVGRVSRLLGIADVDLYVDEITREVTGDDDAIDVVVDIFNRVNSGGTKLSKGDLALAKISADWPQAREMMNAKLERWRQVGYNFKLDWLLRSVNTLLTGEAKFIHLHDRSGREVQDGLERAVRCLDTCLDLIAARLGLDHDRVLFGRFALPVMVRHLDGRSEGLSAAEQGKLLYWYSQAAMWGRFSGSTETAIDRDLEVLERSRGSLDALLDELRLWRGELGIAPGHFEGWSVGARFYPVLYMLTRMGEARDWGTGLPIRKGLLARGSRLELHHIFPKSRLYECGHAMPQVNALANFCFQTQKTNLWITNRFPEDYFAEVEERHPGALGSQWVPQDRDLWRMENYIDFLEARRQLLAAEANRRFDKLLQGMADPTVPPMTYSAGTEPVPSTVGSIATEVERAEIEAINSWVEERHLRRGQTSFDLSDESTGVQWAVLDLAWPDGLQPGLTQPVAVLIDEPPEVLSIANAAGYRCFTAPAEFRSYVASEVLGESLVASSG